MSYMQVLLEELDDSIEELSLQDNISPTEFADLKYQIEWLKIYNASTVEITKYTKIYDQLVRKHMFSNSNINNKPIEQKEKDGLDILKRASRELAETDSVAQDILLNLGQQKTTIQKIDNSTKTINKDLEYSNKILNKMSRR